MNEIDASSAKYSRWLDALKETEHFQLRAVLERLLDELGLNETGKKAREGDRGLSNVATYEEVVGPPVVFSRPVSQSSNHYSSCPSAPSGPLSSVKEQHVVLYRQCAERILLDLLEANLVDPEGWIRYHRNRNWYRPGTILHARGFSCDGVVKVVDAMRSMMPDWIEHIDGFYYRNGSGRGGKCSRMRMSRSLRRRFGVVQHDWIRHKSLPRNARIVMKNASKETVACPDEEHAETMRGRVERMQAFADYAACELRLDSAGWGELRRAMRERQTLVDLTPRSLYRVFNDDSWDKGGRYYGPAYQQIPSKLRKHYYLDGEPTVELDFKCLHPSILYAEAGEVIPEDCYHIPGYDRELYRPLIKRALNVFINASTAIKARESLVRRWEDERRSDSGIAIEKMVWPKMYSGRSKSEVRIAVKELLGAIKTQHHPIATKFGSDEGKRLQNLDAKIVERVCEEAGNLDCPIMIFHDGLRVKISSADTIWRIMRSEFVSRFHQEIKVEAKCPTPPHTVPEYSDVNEELLQKLMSVG